MGWKVRVVPVICLLVGVLFAAPAGARVTQGPSGVRFYSPPAKLLQGVHGTVVWVRTLTGPAALKAARQNMLVIYRSVSPRGKRVFVSGTLAIPRGRPPEGGWPVIAWDHGTTGIADQCAPSRGFANFEDRRVMLSRFLRMGFAVVQTDYQGLGTPGAHPFYIGVAEGRSVIDLVRAARVIDRRVGRRWLPIGVSQGGHATLWAAALGPKWAPELRLVGAVSLAPMSHEKQMFELGRTIATPTPLTVGGALIIAGASTLGWRPSSILTARGVTLLGQVDSRCNEQLKRPDSLGGLAPRDFLRADASYAPLYRILDANDPGTLSIKAPLFIGQGTKDTTVFPGLTDQLVAQLESHGASVQYKLYATSHGTPEVIAAYNDYRSFIAARFRRR